MKLFFVLAAILLCTAAVTTAAKGYIHILQLESYQGKMYLKWVVKHPLFLLRGFIIGAAFLFAAVFFGNSLTAYIILAAASVPALLFALLGKDKSVKPLVYTGRIKRLVALIALIVLSLTVFALNSGAVWLISLSAFLMPLTVFIAYLITYPIEETVKKWYLNDAKRMLFANESLIRIGITGSYGKTSTKYFLGTILSEKYNTLFTPGSFNTPMGVTKVIREQLKDAHQVFIAEMGARYKGDIAELCALVRPQYGILTSVGEQHLETFGSYENVKKTKGELLASLKDGCAFINGENADCVEMSKRYQIKEKYLFSFDHSAYISAENITVNEKGSSFMLVSDENSITCDTVLLGRHNILNLLGAAACAKRLGLTLTEIAAGISKIQPVEHRLQLIPGPVTVIDDAYNSNPAGAEAALNVLKEFKTKRIIVTPGMVELGRQEAEFNRAFGKQIANCADTAILVGGSRADAIYDGLIEGGFDRAQIIRAENMQHVIRLLPEHTVPGCVVLFENDLPDNYN